MYAFSVSVALLVGCALAIPMKDELMFEGPDDTATVESTVREARAAPSHIGDLIQPGVKDAFLYVYGDAENDDGDLHGYSKKMKDKGQDGYKHADKYHKKDGDKYGYEKHSEYGQEHKANIENENEKGLELASFEADGGKSEEDDGEETRKSYAVTEELDADDKKQPKKKVESDYGYFGEGDGSSYYGGGESSEEADGESESAEGDEGDGESEESEESEEGDEEDDY